MKIERIVFMQGHEADEALDIYNNEGTSGLLTYLLQWHYPGERYETSEELGAGTSDRVVQVGNYVLTINSRIGYCGLEHIVL
jgi:hypothetical protein